MSLASAFAPVENANYNRVMQATFGHLAPARRRAIPGSVTFVTSPYSGCTVVDLGFEDTPDSPWLAEAVSDYVCGLADRYGVDEQAGFYRWEGTVTMFDNGAFRFGGETRRLETSQGPRMRRPRRKQQQ
jgi:hypothetical protein